MVQIGGMGNGYLQQDRMVKSSGGTEKQTEIKIDITAM